MYEPHTYSSKDTALLTVIKFSWRKEEQLQNIILTQVIPFYTKEGITQHSTSTFHELTYYFF